jgi:hypothetical protein
MFAADKARKAFIQMPHKQPRRLAQYNMLVTFRDRQLLRQTTKWLHELHGDPITGRPKREYRRELGLEDEEIVVEEEEGGTAPSESAGIDLTKIEVEVVDPPRHGMPMVYLGALSDVHYRTENQTVKRDVVVTRWELEGRHTGRLLGLEPTGRIVNFPGITWVKFDGAPREDGGELISATGLWTVWDMPAVIEQIAATP